MNKIIIEDNFLDKDIFDSIKNTIFDGKGNTMNRSYSDVVFPWYMQNSKVTKEDNEMQLTHVFFRHHKVNSSFFDVLFPIFDKLNVKALHRVKANCTFKTNKKRLYEYHIDIPVSKNKMVGKTSIFYLHTTNGPTFFKIGKKVDCVANRMVTFPNNTQHTGSTHTDSLLRGVININWF
jgi:hypothetical protein|tara:strand:- start:201 stop:734 length:534 start_codon:yes stop_codon:yes gene_type:complete